MAEKNDWYLEGEKPSLRKWVFTEMAMGAVYAALVLFGIIAVILLLRALGAALPEDPFAQIETMRLMSRLV